MLTGLSIRNYRSLESVDVPLSPLTAFVGPNGAGKTSILRALAVLFGDAWPSMRSFRIPQDFTQFETSRPIEITGYFSPGFLHEDALRNTHSVVALRLCCQAYKRSGKWGQSGDLHTDFDALDHKGEVPFVAVTPPRAGTKPSFRPLSVTTDLRDHTRVQFVDHRRTIAQHLPGIRGSVLGKLLEPAHRDFDRMRDFRLAYEQALEILRTDKVREIEATIQETAKRMLGFLGKQASRNLDIGFGFADPTNPFSSLRLEYREDGIAVPGEELGLGIQSAVVVGIFEAFREIGGGVQTVIIEEPEMYLHPQAQRYFYRILRNMAESNTCQVIYATHSPIFADVTNFEALRLVRREPGQRSAVSFVRAQDVGPLSEDRDRQKLAGMFDPTRNEVLFASRALLVEGHGDRAAALEVADKLGVDPDGEGVAIVDCGGKNALPMVARVCRSLDIPFSVLHDSDLWPLPESGDVAKQIEENERAAVENDRIAMAAGSSAQIFVVEPTLEAAVGVGRSANSKPLRVLESIRSATILGLPSALVAAVRSVLPMSGAVAEPRTGSGDV